ncbi:MAG: glycine cleavage system protein GcvH [Planctomycetes bacterium]|nr:glycine cleavage system protein GcvH [Planctomycetota bacterium]
MTKDDRKYLPTHEWCRIQDGIATIGITDFAVQSLSDLVFLDLPPIGTRISADDAFGEIESVKAVSDIVAPVSGEVVEVNEALPDDLDVLKTDPWDAGWMVKVKVTGESGNLLDAASYQRQVEAHE